MMEEVLLKVASPDKNNPQQNEVQRTFIIGSEWLYIKIYTGFKTSDKILIDNIYTFVLYLLGRGMVKKFFFVRYHDPEIHIRLRLLVCHGNFNELFQCFHNYFNTLVMEGLIWKIQCDTYNREIERYGAENIENIESLFYLDSITVLKSLKSLLKSDSNLEQKRWILALILIDNWLNNFDFNINEKYELLKTLSFNYRSEFGFINHLTKKQIDMKYRKNRILVEDVMQFKDVVFMEFEDLIEIIKEHNIKVKQIITDIKLMDNNKTLSLNRLASYLHMTMNRLFRAKHRLHEMVIYYFLEKYYASEQIRLNQINK